MRFVSDEKLLASTTARAKQSKNRKTLILISQTQTCTLQIKHHNSALVVTGGSEPESGTHLAAA
jgi:hypothetical protein